MEKKIRMTLWATAVALVLLCACRLAVAWHAGYADHRFSLNAPLYQMTARV